MAPTSTAGLDQSQTRDAGHRPKFTGLQPNLAKSTEISQLWTDFCKLVKHRRSFAPSDQIRNDVGDLGQNWIHQGAALGCPATALALAAPPTAWHAPSIPWGASAHCPPASALTPGGSTPDPAGPGDPEGCGGRLGSGEPLGDVDIHGLPPPRRPESCQGAVEFDLELASASSQSARLMCVCVCRCVGQKSMGRHRPRCLGRSLGRLCGHT